MSSIYEQTSDETHLNQFDSFPNIQKNHAGDLQSWDGRKLEKVDPDEKSLMSDASRCAQDRRSCFNDALSNIYSQQYA